ncbi:DUF2835 domain-containing protein [Neptuniibacter caesariensis]|jgi:hypothetical protein|uniref:Topoisomerase II n=1 Tax=Neptuniibacter caesariensis TaxID=207954 RepID=A0A7U8C493_NEPCE|nr:DUF2835 domain-containing protein [Neptuniibacter caesariensis]EAR59825.1 hypothetical protein MED92_12596 [Neptuniibacter caesariensis]
MKSIVVDLYISPDKYKKLYQGLAQNVYTRATDGRSVQFPAHILQPFLLSDGIKGRFRINFDDRGKYLGIEKVS